MKLEEIIRKQITEKEEQEPDAERELDKRLNESLNRAADRGATVEAKMSKEKFHKMWMDDNQW